MNTCHGKRHLPYPGDSVPHFQDEVWTPDLALRNSFTEHVPLGYPQLFVHNDYHGNVRWKPFQVCTSGYQPSGVYSVPKNGILFYHWPLHHWPVRINSTSAEYMGIDVLMPITKNNRLYLYMQIICYCTIGMFVFFIDFPNDKLLKTTKPPCLHLVKRMYLFLRRFLHRPALLTPPSSRLTYRAAILCLRLGHTQVNRCVVC